MIEHTSIVTDAARLAAALNLADYTDSINAHLNGDYGQHNEVGIHAGPFLISLVASVHPTRPPHEIDSDLLRLEVTIDDVEYAVIAPAINMGALVSTGTQGGSAGAVAPVFVTSPLTQTAIRGNTVTFLVLVTGTSPITYQWVKNGVNIGTNAPTLQLTNVQDADAAFYNCIAVNSVGTATSQTAGLSVMSEAGVAPPSSTSQSGGGIIRRILGVP